MDGMKSGSGDDPFTTDEDSSGSESDEQADAGSDTDTVGDVDRSQGLPWIYARDNAKTQREMVQFFLQSDTQTLENQAQTELETMLGEEPLKLDVREAAYQVALQNHLDDIAAKLREWGYDAESATNR